MIVTRPGSAGERLVEELHGAGFDALWMPAFDLGPAPDPGAADHALAKLADFDLAVFVSPAAVRGVAGRMHAPWPASTLIGAVGAATAEAVRRWVAGAESARIIAPAPGGGETDEAESGSEALWALLLATGIRPRRVLVLRAQGGRDWLLQRWRDAGVEVNALAVYSRIPHRRTARERDWLQAHGGAAAIATVITSSAAVEALARQLDDLPAVLDAVRAGPALASHPRIAQRLHAAGFASVRVIALEPASIAAALAGAPPASS